MQKLRVRERVHSRQVYGKIKSNNLNKNEIYLASKKECVEYINLTFSLKVNPYQLKEQIKVATD